MWPDRVKCVGTTKSLKDVVVRGWVSLFSSENMFPSRTITYAICRISVTSEWEYECVDCCGSYCLLLLLLFVVLLSFCLALLV